MKRASIALLAALGAIAAAAAIVYFTVPTHALPSFFPGHALTRGKHRTSAAVAALVAVVAWAAAAAVAASAQKQRTPTRTTRSRSADEILLPGIRETDQPTTRPRPVPLSPAWERWVMTAAIAGMVLGLAGAALGIVALNSQHGTTSSTGPPSTKILVPAGGASLKGSQSVAAQASGRDWTKVEFHVSGGKLHDALIGSGRLTFDGWLAQWNTTSVANGHYTIQSVASDADGNSVHSAGVTVTVAN